ncbi:hypothetical protein AAJ76_1260004249 [Vairimorpha ceranae]|uniref:BolA family transcriptional regulator n=1 Tax=Vairimorpha ceranae TaxID=40302 RepID=A0A0F9Z7Z6_9MICR|nr:hypothetical protein AAJ76_1260004249 [Vairimorpha ceranae]KAF5140612.1 hypothetical protein G9O61_00g011080 [Vairimorpha ceranae]KAF5141583.1 hypothetical protein G9O61_00g001250 [Vairimorpha ceranae]KAF5141604.1 hypothetical protein G9O61_00g001460 [Vairimorpha ceranae]KKO74064.1 hypothetical protein AAJ76_1260004249 [Vairimorpha ceranae]
MSLNLQKEISEAIKNYFGFCTLKVENLSYLHVGHKSMKDVNSLETHFKIKIKSKKFNGQSEVERHRMIYKIIDFAFKKGLHAIEMDCESDLE